MWILRVMFLLPFLPIILAAAAFLSMCGMDVKVRKSGEDDWTRLWLMWVADWVADFN